MTTMRPAIGVFALLLAIATPAAAQDAQLRLNIDQREADVIVDGFTVGTIDDFDGAMQHLALSAGQHRIEIRARATRRSR